MRRHQAPQWGSKLGCCPQPTMFFNGLALTGLLRRIAVELDPTSRLKEHLVDLYRDLTSGELAGIRKVEELVVP